MGPNLFRFEIIQPRPEDRLLLHRPQHTTTVARAHWESKIYSASSEKFFEEHHGLGSIKYSADLEQMELLGLLSNRAVQNITINCKERPVWFNEMTQGWENAMKFKGIKETIFQQSRTE